MYGPNGVWTPANNGIDVVTSGGGTISRRWPFLQGSGGGVSDFNGYGQAIWPLVSNTTWALADRGARKIFTMTKLPGGAGSQQILDVTPPFGGTKTFPNDIYDLVFDGTRYMYVSCRDGAVYRIDTTNYAAAPAAIRGFASYPYGLTLMGGVLYAVDRGAGNHSLRRVSSPDSTSTSTVDAGWNPSFGSDLLGLTNHGGNLYVSDYLGQQIFKVSPAGAASVYIAELNGGPSRLAPWNDGRLAVRVSDGVYYHISTDNPPVAAQWISTIGCTGCNRVEFYLDASNNHYWAQPSRVNAVNAYSMFNTRELARDGNTLYVATSQGVYGYDLSAAGDLSVRGADVSIGGMGTGVGLAVNPTTHDLYVLNTGGSYYSIDPINRAVTGRGSLGGSGWGLDIDPGVANLYGACSGKDFVYKIGIGTWTPELLKVGLHAPMF